MRFVSNDAELPLYVHADHLGKPQIMTDQAASLVRDKVQRPCLLRRSGRSGCEGWIGEIICGPIGWAIRLLGVCQ